MQSLRAPSMTTQYRQKGSATAMTREPSGPGAGADDDHPPVAVPGEDSDRLTRSKIMQTALRIIDRDGVDGLSMRRLSAALGRDPVMLYRHVPNKAALLDGVAEIVLGQLAVDTADPDWAAQLRTVAHDFRQLALAHPNVVPLLVTRPLATPLGQRPPGMLRPLEDVLALLTSVGFTGEDALHTYRVLFGYLYGHILNELQEIIERPEETDHVLRLGLHRLAITEFPQLRALAPALASYDGAAELDRFLDLLLPGLTATLTQPHGSPPAD
jgi:AcrR family transcriptional regulator